MIRCSEAPRGEWLKRVRNEGKQRSSFVPWLWVITAKLEGVVLLHRSVVSNLLLSTDTFCCHIKYYPEASCMNSRRRPGHSGQSRGGENKVTCPGPLCPLILTSRPPHQFLELSRARTILSESWGAVGGLSQKNERVIWKGNGSSRLRRRAGSQGPWMGATRGRQALRRKMAGFPGGPVVKTPNFRCREHGFGLW